MLNPPDLKGREGGCQCKQVRYRLLDAPMFVQACHCYDCRRIGGGAFGLNLWIEDFNVDIRGALDSFVTQGGSGKPHEIRRCADCATALFSCYHVGLKNALFVRAGTLDFSDDVAPMAHVHVKNKQNWLVLPDRAPQFDESYKLPEVWPPASLARLKALKSRA